MKIDLMRAAVGTVGGFTGGISPPPPPDPGPIEKINTAAKTEAVEAIAQYGIGVRADFRI